MMRENASKKEAKREQSAILFAEGDKTFAEIAKACGVHEATLYRWQADPSFRSRVDELRTSNFEKLQGEGFRRKDNRLSRLQDIGDRIQLIIDERGAEMGLVGKFTDSDGEKIELAKIPGGKSGLLARSYDKLGNAVYKFDAALVRELRETMKQAAMEMGQWVEKTEANDTTETHVTIYLPDNERNEENETAS